MRKVKTSGEPDKHLKARKIARSEKQAGKVKATERKLAQLERVDKPWEGWRLELALQPTARSGDVVVRLEDAVIERRADGGDAGDGSGFRLGPIDLEIAWQDRLGILGPNGSGKTTLIQGLLGTAPLVQGRRWIGPGRRDR